MAALWALPAAVLTLQPAALTLGSRCRPCWRPGLIPLGLGHTLYNAALRRTHATIVNLIATQEVTGGIVLGAILLGQVPQASEIVGAVVALVGIAVVLI